MSVRVLAVSMALAIAAPNTLQVTASTTNQLLQTGSTVFGAGAQAVKFPVTFSSPPTCFCNDTLGALTQCSAGIATKADVTFYGTVKRNFNWLCVGPM